MDKRDRTHASLRDAALRLFAEHGYDTTTTAQVARHAGVSEMTLFRHFATKEALLLEDPFDPVMAKEVRARPVSEQPMRAVCEGVRAAWTTMSASDVADLRWLLGMVSGTASLHGAVERSSHETVSALTDALQDRGVAPVAARVAATATIAGLSRALLDWSRDEDGDLNERVTLALDVLGGQ